MATRALGQRDLRQGGSDTDDFRNLMQSYCFRLVDGQPTNFFTPRNDDAPRLLEGIHTRYGSHVRTAPPLPHFAPKPPF